MSSLPGGGFHRGRAHSARGGRKTQSLWDKFTGGRSSKTVLESFAEGIESLISGGDRGSDSGSDKKKGAAALDSSSIPEDGCLENNNDDDVDSSGSKDDFAGFDSSYLDHSEGSGNSSPIHGNAAAAAPVSVTEDSSNSGVLASTIEEIAGFDANYFDQFIDGFSSRPNGNAATAAAVSVVTEEKSSSNLNVLNSSSSASSASSTTITAEEEASPVAVAPIVCAWPKAMKRLAAALYDSDGIRDSDDHTVTSAANAKGWDVKEFAEIFDQVKQDREAEASFTLKELLSYRENPNSDRFHGCNLDRTTLETYLSDSDFQQAFKMTPDDFKKLPKWKQKNAKMEVGLF